MLPHRGTTILVLGILGLVLCAPLGVFAWVMGKGDLAKIDAGAMDPAGRGTTQAGMILGIIGTISLIVQLVLGGLFLAGLVMAVGSEVSSSV